MTEVSPLQPSPPWLSRGARLYLVELVGCPHVELVLDSIGNMSGHEAVIRAIAAFNNDASLPDIQPGDEMKVSGPYDVLAPREAIISEDHLAEAEEL